MRKVCDTPRISQQEKDEVNRSRKKCERQEEVKVKKRAKTNKDTYKKKRKGQEEALGNKMRPGGKRIGARRTGTMR